MVKRYKTKPCEIEALQWTGENHEEMFDFFTEQKEEIDIENILLGLTSLEGALIVKTLEGNMTASVGDYIIKGLRGEFYPCKPDVFEKKYELIK